MKKVIIKDWHIIPSWARGLALGAIIGAILLIISLFFIDYSLNLEFIPIILLTCIILGTIIGNKYKL